MHTHATQSIAGADSLDDVICRILAITRRGRYNLLDEKITQIEFAATLESLGIEFAREVVLGQGDKVDFLVEGGLAIELKIKGAKRAIFKQLERYARHDQVKAIMLLSAQHLPLPRIIEDKPAFVGSLSVGRL
jgi:hypothetical protein